MQVWWVYFDNPNHRGRPALFTITSKSVNYNTRFDGGKIVRVMEGDVPLEEIGECTLGVEYHSDFYTSASNNVCSICQLRKTTCGYCRHFARGIQLPVKEAAIVDGEYK